MGFVAAYCAFPAEAIDPHRDLSQYMRDHWGSEKGFTGGSVTAVAQTADGYLWIGTERGLIRFDGLSFRTFPQAAPTAFSIGAVQQLVADSQGDLWILLQSTKILRYHLGKFELGREEAEFGITAITKRLDGKILFSSLATLHNIRHFLDLMWQARQSIMGGKFPEFLRTQASGFSSLTATS